MKSGKAGINCDLPKATVEAILSIDRSSLPEANEVFGEEMEALFNRVKDAFDPENLFNPHKKVGVDFNYIKQHLRHEYSIKSLEHLEQQKAQDTIDR